MLSYAGSLSRSTAPGTELRDPRKCSQPDPHGREHDVEQEVPDQKGEPPDSPTPERDTGFRAHDAAGAFVSSARSSTTRRMRYAVSSIDSSEMSITGQRSRRWSFFACSSSS